MTSTNHYREDLKANSNLMKVFGLLRREITRCELLEKEISLIKKDLPQHQAKTSQSG